MSERHRPMDPITRPPATARRGAWLALAGLVVLGHMWLVDAWLRRPTVSDRVGTPAPLAVLDTRTMQAAPTQAAAPAPPPAAVQAVAPMPVALSLPASTLVAPALLPMAEPVRVVRPEVAQTVAAASPATVPQVRAKPARPVEPIDPARHTAPDAAPEPSHVTTAVAIPVAEPPVPATPAAERMAEAATAPMPDPALLLALAPTGAGPVAAATSTGATTALVSNLPPSAQLSYRLSKGLLSGTGRIDWTLSGDRYRLRLEARVPVFGQIFQQTSEGRIDAHGVAPVRHTESAIRRSQRAVNFVRDGQPPRVQFSAREGSEPLRAGAQDRVSWIAQLAGRLGARAPADWTPGSRIEMDVASVGGDVQHWVFTIIDRDSDNRWHLRREAEGPRDTRAEVWLDPARHLWPTRIRLTEPAGDPLELTLSALESS